MPLWRSSSLSQFMSTSTAVSTTTSPQVLSLLALLVPTYKDVHILTPEELKVHILTPEELRASHQGAWHLVGEQPRLEAYLLQRGCLSLPFLFNPFLSFFFSQFIFVFRSLAANARTPYPFSPLLSVEHFEAREQFYTDNKYRKREGEREGERQREREIIHTYMF